MSARLLNLLLVLGVSGLVAVGSVKPDKPTADDRIWMDRSIEVLKDAGIPSHAQETDSPEDQAWFRQFLKQHDGENPVKFETSAIEKRLKVKLPKSYLDFMAKVGPMTFHDVDSEEGTVVKILPPQKLDASIYRKGQLRAEDAESNLVDGVMFAEIEHGDVYCFDVRKDRKE